MIYKREGQCNTEPKCNWNDGGDVRKKTCDLNSDEQTCLDNTDCYYEYNSNKCLPKGICESRNIYNEPTQIGQVRAEYSLEGDIGRLYEDGRFHSGLPSSLPNTGISVPPYTHYPMDHGESAPPYP